MTPLDKRIEKLVARLRCLSDSQVALHFTVCGERVMALYALFHTAEAWGEPDVLRGALDRIWMALRGRSATLWCEMITAIEEITPHADDFDNLLATLAQDACIVVDCAVRAMNHEPMPEGLQYIFEALRVSICFKETGNLDLGGGVEYEQFERSLVENELVQKELAFQLALIEQVERWSAPGEPQLEMLRDLARRNPLVLPDIAEEGHQQHQNQKQLP